MIPTRALVAAAAVGVVLGAAVVAEPALLLPMLGFDLALAVLAAIDAVLTRGRISARRELPQVQAVGRPFEVTMVLGNDGRRPLRVRATDDAPGVVEGLPIELELPAGAEAERGYELRVDRRGQHHFGPITVRWRSPLGLWERQRRIAVSSTVRVYPDFAQLRRYGMDADIAEQRIPVRVRRRPGGENEFERLRPYVPGDPYRHIDWRATARRREFITREFGQESNQNLIFLLDCGRMMSASSGGLTAFDHALNAAMMMGQVGLKHGDRVGVLAFDRSVRVWLPPRGGARSGSRLIRGTYDLFPSLHEPDYALAFRYLAQRVRRRSLVVLMTAVVDEVNAELATVLVSALARRHVAITVWVRDTDIEGMVERSSHGALSLYQRCAAAELIGWRERSLAALRRRGALVVDCAPGDLTPQLLSRYLEIKARHLL